MLNYTHETLTSSLCVILFRLTWGSGMTTVSPIRTPQLSAVLYTITTIHVSSLSTMPNVLQKRKSARFNNTTPEIPKQHVNKWAINDKVSCTHKAMRPSEARLNTTLPRAATPALWPCVREDRVRGSRLPTRPVGERNWGEEQGPKADVLRLESIVRNRRAFTFPWRDGEAEG